MTEPSTERREDVTDAAALAVAISAWIVPGLGHLLQRRWVRALGFFAATAGLVLVGCAMRGEVFTARSADPFGALGFFADGCSGILYLMPHFVEAAGPDISRAAGDYGTRFIAAAGIVNLLGVLDAYGVARGRRG
ncbi:MAG TPA: DUF6677 family protein [Candidatus Acidoferrales bacterium]|nr:DUF6677 family protein [Candidatus Acidoferrales bacterium]